MHVLAVQNSVSFGRTLSKREEKELTKLQTQAKNELEHDITTATIFDFSFPKEKNDTGIGTSFSIDAQKMASFLQTMCGINSIQLQPQGQISNFVRSPYSGTSFSLGMHIIDLNKLHDKQYGSLLTDDDLKSPYMTAVHNDEKANYEHIFNNDGQKEMLKRAYDKFVLLKENSDLKQEYKEFKKENEYWLERDALFEAAAVDNDSENMKEWSIRDQNIFATKDGDKKRIAELKKVTDNKGRNIVDFEEFVQFIANKQQKESKNNFNKNGIDIFGDCQIGFSQKDVWAHKSAFAKDLEFGCEIGGGKYTCWAPAIDFNKLDGEAGELLFKKFDTFFKRYDGVRVDAAWQLVNPLIVEPLYDKKGNEIFDENGNKLGKPAAHYDLKDKILKDIVLKAAKENGKNPKKIFLEMLGGNSYNSLDATKDLGATLIHITKYAGDNWGRVKYYESVGESKYQNMKPGDYIIGPGTHDDESLISQFDNYGSVRAKHLANDLGLDKRELETSVGKWSDASFAELFTTKNQFITLPDILGSDKRINKPDVQIDNWNYRAGNNYKEKYYENLSKGLGLNLPDALSKALKAQGKDSELTKKLDRYAEILREPEMDINV